MSHEVSWLWQAFQRKTKLTWPQTLGMLLFSGTHPWMKYVSGSILVLFVRLLFLLLYSQYHLCHWIISFTDSCRYSCPTQKTNKNTCCVCFLLDNSSVLRSYMRGEALPKDTQSIVLACFLVYRSIPCLRNTHTQLEGKTNICSH